MPQGITPQKRPRVADPAVTAKKQAVVEVLGETCAGSCRLPDSTDDASASRVSVICAMVIGEDAQLSLGRCMLQFNQIGDLMFGADTAFARRWADRGSGRVLDAIFSGEDDDAADGWRMSSVRKRGKTTYVSLAGAQLLAALACGKCKGVDLASLPRRLAALASWRRDSSESVGGGIVIFTTAPAVESPFAQASEKTRLTLQAERALGGAPKAAGGGGHAAGNTRAAQLEARRLTWAQPILC